jgi:sugar/nucleoside kinase (ribokinase family)
MAMTLLAIGTLAYDDIETATAARKKELGGSAVHFGVSAGKFGPVRLVGVVGDDFEDAHLRLLAERGVDTSGIEVAAGKTFRWACRYEADWNTRHTLDTQLGVFEHFDPKLSESHKRSEIVFLANAEPAVQAKGLDQVERPSFTMLDTMNYWIQHRREDLLGLLRRVDAIVLNDEEARMLTGEKNLIRAASGVLGLGPRYVILKKGEHGAFIMGADVHFSLPAYPVVDVVDPTGAGDSFAGGFLGHLASERQLAPPVLKQAMLYGTVTASFCVEGFGLAGLAGRTRREIDARYGELLAIVTV